MATPILFHGPQARGAAVTHARSIGRLLLDPLGDEGLKVAEARAVVDLAGTSGVGDQPPSVVLGPLDRATPSAGDALLKTLEDLSTAPLQIVLWADFLGGVSLTLRSRSLPRWCPPEPHWVSPYMDEDAKNLWEAYTKKDLGACLEILRKRQKDWGDLLQGVCEVSAEQEPLHPSALRLWAQARPLLDGKGSFLNAAHALTECLA